MPNKFIENGNDVSVRLDGAYISGKNFFVTPFVNDEGKERYFGKFRFSKPEEAKKTLQDAVKFMQKKNPQLLDTVFAGQYPKWIESEQYGKQFSANNRIKFFKKFGEGDEIEPEEIEDYTYALEVHLSPTKSNDIYVRVSRAIAMSKLNKYNNALFEGEEAQGIDISEDDLPF